MVEKIVRFGCAVLLVLLVATPAFAQHGSYHGPNFHGRAGSLYRPYGPYYTTGGLYGASILFYPRMYSYHGANRTRSYDIDQQFREQYDADEENRQFAQWLKEWAKEHDEGAW